MEYREDEWLQLSGLQHFAFCRRQWALIHVEQLWAENLKTVEGDLLHRKAHDHGDRESRGDLYILRGVSIQSRRLARNMIFGKLYHSAHSINRTYRDHALRVNADALRGAEETIKGLYAQVRGCTETEALRGL